MLAAVQPIQVGVNAISLNNCVLARVCGMAALRKRAFALAALAATGLVSAQSSVTMFGLADIGYGSHKTTGPAGASIKSLGVMDGANAGSRIGFRGTEDLGGGLNAQAFVALDPRDFAADGAGIARHETYIGVSGAFGNLRLGAVNSGSLAASGAGSVLGTATGSGYGLADLAAGGSIRYSRGVRYDTPRVNGIAASINYVPGNDDGTAGAAAAGRP
jgi:predicted porin